MIVKDADAPDYECPQAMTSEKYVYCRGSRCMAWRWAEERNPEYKQPHAMQYPPLMPWDNPITIKSTTHGYCGLAGRP